MSWVSKNVSFVRRDGRISPVASEYLKAGTVFYCEIPVTCPDAKDHLAFTMACADVWSRSRMVFPCAFNSLAHLETPSGMEILDALFPKQTLAKSIATSLKTECPQNFLFTGVQVFDRVYASDEYHNTSIVTLADYSTFLVTLRDVSKGEILVCTSLSTFNKEVETQVLINTTSLKSIGNIFGNLKVNDLNVKSILQDAFRMMNTIKLLPIPSKAEIDKTRKAIETFVIKKHLGFSKFKKESELLIEETVLQMDDPVDFEAMENEYERLLSESEWKNVLHQKET